ncbi:MAG TPA: IclR family transcriptional regulator [Synergistaceae bacterium]|nr:IclR family transcriptional regulator [Synergistaceae bacterium]HPJ25596.1 IclR family transcriptional regulator [Synergistaceae bacterium]HPQ37717.1 IclR family transcriptional regulator [Synergistaceae bacterium]
MTSSQHNTTEKTALLMELLAISETPLSLREMASQTGISRSTVHRIMQSLESFGWVEKESLQGYYRPGMGFFFLAGQENSFESLLALGIPVMERLVQGTSQTALISVLEGYRGRCVASVPSPRAVQFVAKKGMVFPLNGGATGKVLLAHAPEALQHFLLFEKPLERYTENTVTDPEELQRELEIIRRRGYAISREEFMHRTAALSVPLFEGEGRFLGQLGISGHMEDFREYEKEFLPTILRASQDISAALERNKESRKARITNGIPHTIS